MQRDQSPPTRWFRTKDCVFAGIGLMSAYVLYHNERFLIDAADPMRAHFEPFKWWLLPHGVAGACALLVAPLQFSDRLRRRWPKWHRIAGRVYVMGVVILAPLGVYIEYFEERLGSARSFTIALGADAALLLVTTGIAFFYARKRKIPQHRQWMTRSYAVALVFFESRFILGVTGWEALGEGVAETVVWTCLAFAILFGDLVNQWQESRVAPRTGPRALSTAIELQTAHVGVDEPV
jgi:uncharacterized membrane protein